MLQLKCPNCGADITLDDTRPASYSQALNDKK